MGNQKLIIYKSTGKNKLIAEQTNLHLSNRSMYKGKITIRVA